MVSSGVVNLKELYDFVRKQKRPLDWRALVVDGSEKLSNTYVKCCKAALTQTPKVRGIYLWGFYTHSGFWVNVYLGKSGLRKTANLRGRLFKELTAERSCIWREAFPNKEALLTVAEYTANRRMWPQYKKQWEGSLRKAGSTHIYWVDISHLKEDDVEPIERDLIEAMNPTGNRKRNLPPSQTLRDESIQIFQAFRNTIDLPANRKSRFELGYHREFWRWVGETEPKP
jgi:hypothetical protein